MIGLVRFTQSHAFESMLLEAQAVSTHVQA